MTKPLDGLRHASEQPKTIMLPFHKVLARASEGPFLCSNCEYARDHATRCTHDYIVKHFGPSIAPGDCCDFFEKL